MLMLPVQCRSCEHRFETHVLSGARCPECGSDQLDGPAALQAAPSRAATTELPGPPATPKDYPRETFTVSSEEARRMDVAMFLGGFVEALLDGAHGVEVRVRRRDGALTVQGNVYLPGGRRIEDSQRVAELEITNANTDAFELGRLRGTEVARVLAAARPE